jgi:hypothetical protein
LSSSFASNPDFTEERRGSHRSEYLLIENSSFGVLRASEVQISG